MYDTLVIGAGAAGVEAAHHLASAGLRFAVLEARSEVGGRIRGAIQNAAIELGAEFLHGEAPLTRRRLEKYGLSHRILAPDFHVFEDGRLRREPDYWRTLARAFSHLHSTRGDRPFGEAVDASKTMSAEEKKRVKAFVGGFDAADLGRVSTNALREGASLFRDEKERALGRPTDGYRPLLEAMAGPIRESIQFGEVVTRIAWEPGFVAVHAEGAGGEKIHHARSALITLPIGVLKTPAGVPGAIRFAPEVPRLAGYLARLEMGQAVRLTLEFDPAARSLFAPKFPRGLPFVSSPSLDFMTWWSEGRKDHLAIVAWAGGAHARKLATRSRPERVEIAIENLGRVIGLRTSTLEVALRKAHQHDWAEDPFARGAYSYPGVGADAVAEKLRRPIEKTLYFAGEAVETDSGGTVEAAIASGKRQAAKVIRDLTSTNSRGRKTTRTPARENAASGILDAK